MMLIDLTQAKARVQSAERAYKEAKRSSDRAGLLELSAELRKRKNIYHILVVNEGVASLIAEGTDPIPRDELRDEVNEATRSKLNFGDEILRAFEKAQLRGGRFTKWQCKARDINGSFRPMSVQAFERVLEVLDMYCPRRSDNGLYSPPYRLKLNDREEAIPE